MPPTTNPRSRRNTRLAAQRQVGDLPYLPDLIIHVQWMICLIVKFLTIKSFEIFTSASEFFVRN